MKACQSLAHQGYRIALDDFVFHPRYELLLQAASLIKIEIESVSRSQQEKMISVYHGRGIKVVAEKVENYEQFEWARKTGYDFFQGYFFARPVMMRGQQIPAGKIHQLRLLQEIQPRQLDFNRLASLISEDVAFSYKLLRFASSALFSRLGRIASIRAALVTLGEDNIRRWAALVTLSSLAEDKPGELVACSLIRAQYCALIGQRVGAELREQGFLMGLFSLLDALLERPLDEALAEVRLAPAIKTALLGLAPDGDALSTLYKLVRHYELADWDEVGRLAGELKIPAQAARETYSEAVRWANETLSVS
jgi:EAL and modified HD-GYP domain-containing signal transduction protein